MLFWLLSIVLYLLEWHADKDEIYLPHYHYHFHHTTVLITLPSLPICFRHFCDSAVPLMHGCSGWLVNCIDEAADEGWSLRTVYGWGGKRGPSRRLPETSTLDPLHAELVLQHVFTHQVFLSSVAVYVVCACVTLHSSIMHATYTQEVWLARMTSSLTNTCLCFAFIAIFRAGNGWK